jgi:hypothetical protein
MPCQEPFTVLSGRQRKEKPFDALSTNAFIR